MAQTRFSPTTQPFATRPSGFNALFSHQAGVDNTATGDSPHERHHGLQQHCYRVPSPPKQHHGHVEHGYGVTSSTHEHQRLNNTATGTLSLRDNTSGTENTADGAGALADNTTGGNNTAIGGVALSRNTTGSGNIAIGVGAGEALTTGNNNIEIGNVGFASDTKTIRIGTNGTATRTLIAGINNSPIFASSVPVVVNINGRLGFLGSSARYKRDIRDMGDASAGLLRLRPVSFRYKQDAKGTLQYGLIAEEVARVYPELVTYGADGKVETVAYHLLPAMLLNEMQRQVRENQRKDAQIVALQKQIESLQKKTARIDTLTARLNALEQQARRAGPDRLAAATR